MNGFVKLFASIVTSSVWVEPDSILRVWIAMLATADSDGRVQGSVPGFASLARVGVEDMRAALERLSGPDRDSRTKDHEGRRIQEIDGGWQILNYASYRERGQGKDGSRAPYFRDYRARRKSAGSATGSATPGATGRVARNTEEEAEAEAERTTAPPTPPDGGKPAAAPRGKAAKAKKPAKAGGKTAAEKERLEQDAIVAGLADAWAKHRGKDGRQIAVLRAAAVAVAGGYQRVDLERVSELVALAGREPEKFEQGSALRWAATHNPSPGWVWRAEALEKLIPEAAVWPNPLSRPKTAPAKGVVTVSGNFGPVPATAENREREERALAPPPPAPPPPPAADPDAAAAWARVVAACDVTAHQRESWLGPEAVVPVGMAEDKVRLWCSQPHVAEYLRTQLLKPLQAAIKASGIGIELCGRGVDKAAKGDA